MGRNQRFETFLGIIFGLASLISLCINIAFTYSSYRNQSNTSYRDIILTLGVSTITLTAVFVFASYYYLRKLSDLTNINSKIEETISRNKRNEILIKNTSEIISNLTYYQREILYKMDYFLYSDTAIDIKTLNKTCDDFGMFLSTFTSNLQTYFTLFTSDNCAVTIKIVKDRKVKTCYRDAVSYRFRKESDRTLEGKDFIYNISDNFAFHVIHSKDYKETYYFCDDLKNDQQYFNLNTRYKNFYNATAVTPISIEIGKSETELLGFLCIDNFNGNLGQKPVEGMLQAPELYFFRSSINSKKYVSLQPKKIIQMIESPSSLIGTIVDKSKATKTLDLQVPAYLADSYVMNFPYKKEDKKYHKKKSFLTFLITSLFFLR